MLIRVIEQTRMHPLASIAHPSADSGVRMRRRVPSARTSAVRTAIAAPAPPPTRALPAAALAGLLEGVVLLGRKRAGACAGALPWGALQRPPSQTLMAAFRSLPARSLQADISALSSLELRGPKVVLTNERTREVRKPERHSSAAMRLSGYTFRTSA